MKYARILLTLPPELLSEIDEASRASTLSRAAWIRTAILEKLAAERQEGGE